MAEETRWQVKLFECLFECLKVRSEEATLRKKADCALGLPARLHAALSRVRSYAVRPCNYSVVPN